MLALFLKYRRPCFLALCALLGLACGDLAATLTGLRLGRDRSPQATAPAANRPAAATDPAADLAFILQHNLFDQGARTATAPPFSLHPGEGRDGAARSQFELVGTVVAGERSLAVLRSGQETNSYGFGEELPGGGQVTEIARHQIKIRNPDRSVTTLTLPEGGRPAPYAAVSSTATAGSGGELRMVSENRWVIPRDRAASVRDNLGEQLRMSLMQPRMVDGRTDGFIIKKITPGTLVAQMGLRRGDIIKRVNTMTIDSPEKALQILQQLREARQLNIDLERDGKPLSFAYAIE